MCEHNYPVVLPVYMQNYMDNEPVGESVLVDVSFYDITMVYTFEGNTFIMSGGETFKIELEESVVNKKIKYARENQEIQDGKIL